MPGALPMGNVGFLGGIAIPGTTPVTGALSMNAIAASYATIPQAYQVPLIPPQTATVIQKLIQVSSLLGIFILLELCCI